MLMAQFVLKINCLLCPTFIRKQLNISFLRDRHRIMKIKLDLTNETK
jgi:hypothetical protein